MLTRSWPRIRNGSTAIVHSLPPADAIAAPPEVYGAVRPSSVAEGSETSVTAPVPVMRPAVIEVANCVRKFANQTAPSGPTVTSLGVVPGGSAYSVNFAAYPSTEKLPAPAAGGGPGIAPCCEPQAERSIAIKAPHADDRRNAFMLTITALHHRDRMSARHPAEDAIVLGGPHEHGVCSLVILDCSRRLSHVAHAAQRLTSNFRIVFGRAHDTFGQRAENHVVERCDAIPIQLSG